MNKKGTLITAGILVIVIIVLGVFVQTKVNAPEVPGNANATSTEITLGVGQTGMFRDLSITAKSILQDSRCPIDVECIQAGSITVNVSLKSGGQTGTQNIASNGAAYSFAGYKISISKVDPPRMSKVEISPDAYHITFHIDSAAL